MTLIVSAQHFGVKFRPLSHIIRRLFLSLFDSAARAGHVALGVERVRSRTNAYDWTTARHILFDSLHLFGFKRATADEEDRQVGILENLKVFEIVARRGEGFRVIVDWHSIGGVLGFEFGVGVLLDVVHDGDAECVVAMNVFLQREIVSELR